MPVVYPTNSAAIFLDPNWIPAFPSNSPHWAELKVNHHGTSLLIPGHTAVPTPTRECERTSSHFSDMTLKTSLPTS